MSLVFIRKRLGKGDQTHYPPTPRNETQPQGSRPTGVDVSSEDLREVLRAPAGAVGAAPEAPAVDARTRDPPAPGSRVAPGSDPRRAGGADAR